MSKREILAYAITHAPRGQKGGPYEGHGPAGDKVPSLALAQRYAHDALGVAHEDTSWLVRQGHAARVIRIVRAERPAPSEASAAAVLRELVAWGAHPSPGLLAIVDRARAVLAEAGPDPSEVVRAAMQETEAEEALRVSVAAKNNAPGVGLRWRAAVDAWLAASKRLKAARAERGAAVDAFRKAGGK